MILYGVTMDFQVIPVRLGSKQMMDCRNVHQTKEQAEFRANEMRLAAITDSEASSSASPTSTP